MVVGKGLMTKKAINQFLVGKLVISVMLATQIELSLSQHRNRVRNIKTGPESELSQTMWKDRQSFTTVLYLHRSHHICMRISLNFMNRDDLA